MSHGRRYGRIVYPSPVDPMSSSVQTRRVARHAAFVAAIAVAGATIASVRASSLGATPRAALDDPTIVAIFDAANTWDIETGKLAEKKGTTKEIRDFGAMLAHDHAMVRQQGRDLAKKLGVTPTPPKPDDMAAGHAAAM